MAGITDSPYRRIAKKWGAELVYTEMVSSNGLVHRDKKTFSLVRFKKCERPAVVQIFGKEAKKMAEAAKILEKEVKPDGIDINFGCPAKKVISLGHGAALMDEPKLAEKLVQAVRKTTLLPLSVKCRLGAKKKDEIFDFAKRMEKAGAAAIAIHGRTLKQGFKGEADWKPIYEVKKKTKMIVIGNGDIKERRKIDKRLGEGKIDGVMIGRGALGNPFIFSINRPSSIEKVIKVALEHAKLAYKEKGKRGIIGMRKHLAWYIKGFPDSRKLRQRLARVESLGEIEKILKLKSKI